MGGGGGGGGGARVQKLIMAILGICSNIDMAGKASQNSPLLPKIDGKLEN